MTPTFDAAARADLEFLPPPEWQAVQTGLLEDHLEYVAEHSPFYRKILAGGSARLADLPFTTKADLANAAADFLCVDTREVVDYCLTSGTTGSPVAMLETKSDLDRVGFNEEISFEAAGLTADDVVLVAAGLDRCFMAGLAYFLGLSRLGAAAIRGGSGSIPALMELVVDHRPSAIVGVPTMLLELGRRLQAAGHEPSDLGARRLICIGEPVRQTDLGLSKLGRALQDMWAAAVLGTYASTEMATAFADCTAEAGGHVHPDLIVVELVDDEGTAVPPGEVGEVVATPLGVTGMPLVRFRTGDLAILYEATCECGRTTPRLGPILGRKSQALKVKGTTVYPPAIFETLQEIPGVSGYYIEVRSDFDLSDQVLVVVGAGDESLDAAEIAATIAGKTRVKPDVELRPPGEVRARTLEEGKRKPTTFFDLRSQPQP